jgi:hypothetical protein
VAGSLIYVGTHAITHGKLDVAKQVSREMGAFLEANHPRMLHFGIYIDDDAHEMTVIQIHPDEDSLVLHLKLARERIAKAYDFLDETTKIDIYGRPSDVLVIRSGRWEWVHLSGSTSPPVVSAASPRSEPDHPASQPPLPRPSARPENPPGQRGSSPLAQAAAGLSPLPTRQVVIPDGPTLPFSL